MIIDLKKIKDEQEIRLSHEYNPHRQELDFDDFYYTVPVKLEGSAYRQNESLEVKGHLTSTCRIICSRCLKEFNSDINEGFDLYFDITNKHEIDITDDIRELLIFLHSQQYLCSDKCKGICPGCGADLNKEPCACTDNKTGVSEEGLQSHLSELKKLKDKLNDIEKEK
jgi:uncharacterized protein